jgi:hypothetical protein
MPRHPEEDFLRLEGHVAEIDPLNLHPAVSERPRPVIFTTAKSQVKPSHVVPPERIAGPRQQYGAI